MNFYNPYMNVMPYMSSGVRTGLFSRLFRNGFSFSSLLSGTQRTLGFINQAIPAIRNVSPIIKNAKTMFKVMNEFKKTDSNKKINTPVRSNQKNNINKTNKVNINEQNNINEQKNNVPTFFI